MAIDRIPGSTPGSSFTQADSQRIIVDGSERALVPESKLVGDVDPNERIDITVRLHPQAPNPDGFDGTIDRAGVEARYASRPEDAARVAAFAQAHGLDVVSTDLVGHGVVLSGTAQSLGDAFGVKLHEYASPEGEYRGREGDIAVPSSIGDAVAGVFGLDDRDQGTTNMVPLRTPTSHALTPLDVAKAYDFPTGDGAGEHIAVISLGGHYDDAVQSAYLRSLDVAHKAFNVTKVDGGADEPSDPGPTGENMLDAEIIGALVPAADKTMYIAPNSDRGFLDALSKAMHDPKHQNGTISISWGSPEERYTPQFFKAMNEELREAKAMGINVFAAAGDNGATDGLQDARLHTDFPASSDGAIAVGGTKLTLRNGTIAKEVVWNELPDEGATGGGVSDRVPLPTMQTGSHVPQSPGGTSGRGVPDIAADADPLTGYTIMLPRGESIVEGTVGGTSAGAPLYAALAARLGQDAGDAVKNLQQTLYDAPASAFHDVTQGNNGGYAAGPGWDAASGRGSVDGAKLLAYLQSQHTSGTHTIA